MLDFIEWKVRIYKKRDGSGENLAHAVNQYRRLTGLSWRQFILRAVAEYISKREDNPDLVMLIVDYLVDNQ